MSNKQKLKTISQSTWYLPKIPNKSKSLILMPDSEVESYGSPLSKIDQFISDVIKSKQLAFTFEMIKSKSVFIPEREIAISHKLSEYYRFFNQWNTLVSFELTEDHIYCPSVTLFQEAFASSHVLFEFDHINLNDKFHRQKLFNNLIIEIRNIYKNGRYQKQMYRHTENMVRGKKNVSGYIKALFQQCARLLILRFDLGYGSEYTANVDFELAAQHREAFFKRIADNKKYSEKIKGYVWKMEFGEDRGFHFHVIMFMDGSKVQSASRWCKIFIKDWKQVVAPEFQKLKANWSWKHEHNPAWGWNCNNATNMRKLNATGRLGIGMIHRSDHEKIKNLQEGVVQYLFKTEQYVMAKPIGRRKGRIYGRGKIPKDKKMNKCTLSSDTLIATSATLGAPNATVTY